MSTQTATNAHESQDADGARRQQQTHDKYRHHHHPAGLGHRYWKVWSAATVSSVGDGLALVAFPLLAASLTRNPALVAGTVVAQELPWLVVALPAGVLADRINRGRLMYAVDAIRTAIMLVLGLTIVTHALSLPVLYLTAFALGSFETVFSGAAHAVVPDVIGDTSDERLDKANGYLFSAQTSGQRLAGPAVGGLLFAAAAAAPFILDGVSFLLSAGLLALAFRATATTTNKLPTREQSTTSTTFVDDLRAGIAFFRQSQLLRLLSLVIGGLAFCQAMTTGILVLFALDKLHLTRAGYGLFLAAAALGNIAGGIVAQRVRRRYGTARILTFGALAAAAAYLGIGLTSSPFVAAGLFIIEAIAVACGSVASISLRQSAVPEHLRGRVGSTFRMIIWGAIPIGALVGGVVATQFGLRTPFFVAGVAQLTLALLTANALRRVVIDLREPRATPLQPIAAS
jgi:MFS family permease